MITILIIQGRQDRQLLIESHSFLLDSFENEDYLRKLL